MNEIENKEIVNSERLEENQEYRNLTEIQKKILFEHNENPKLTQKDISEKIGCSRLTVFNFYHSKSFERLTTEIGHIKKTELILPALLTLEEALKSRNENVRLLAAKTILGDAGVIKDSPKIDNSKKSVIINWKKEDNGVSNTLLPTGLSETGS